MLIQVMGKAVNNKLQLRPLLAESCLLIQQFFDYLNYRFREKQSFVHVRQRTGIAALHSIAVAGMIES